MKEIRYHFAAKLVYQLNCSHPRDRQTNWHLSDPLAPRICLRCKLKLGSRREQKIEFLKRLAVISGPWGQSQ